MNDEDRLDKIQEILKDLLILAEDHILLLEGLKDRQSLECLGITGEVFMIQSEGGPLRAAEYVASRNKKAVILTDWDKKGRELASDLEKQLFSLGVKYDNSIRIKLSILSKKYVKDVESLDSLVSRLSNSITKL